VYEKSHNEFDKYLSDHKLPLSSHAGIPDTSELLMLQPKSVALVRPIYKQVYGDAIDAKTKTINNGITGDPRASSVELAKIDMEITVKNGYEQITKMIAEKRKTSNNQ